MELAVVFVIVLAVAVISESVGERRARWQMQRDLERRIAAREFVPPPPEALAELQATWRHMTGGE